MSPTSEHPKARFFKRKPPLADPFNTSEPIEALKVRRAPKYTAFLIAGAVVGIIAALIVAVQPSDGKYTASTVFGFFLVIFAVVGAILGGVVALVIDWVGRRSEARVSVAEVPEQAGEQTSVQDNSGERQTLSESDDEASDR